MTKYGTEPGLEDTMKSVICGSTDVNHGCQPEKKLLVEEEAFPCDLTSVRPKSSQGLKPMPQKRVMPLLQSMSPTLRRQIPRNRHKRVVA